MMAVLAAVAVLGFFQNSLWFRGAALVEAAILIPVIYFWMM
jgi:hypothetical protein